MTIYFVKVIALLNFSTYTNFIKLIIAGPGARLPRTHRGRHGVSPGLVQVGHGETGAVGAG